jgi:hypothetical protein
MSKRKKRVRKVSKKKSSSKKGAIELSMTTIIVIVIGVTLLSLGLFWIRGIFRDIDSLTSGAFDTAEGQIGALFQDIDSYLTISPDNIDVEQGKFKDVTVIIANLGMDDLSVRAEIKTNTDPRGIDCGFDDTLKDESNLYNLASGEQVDLGLIVLAKPGVTLGIKSCLVEVPNIPSGDRTDAVIVNVVKKKGIFG